MGRHDPCPAVPAKNRSSLPMALAALPIAPQVALVAANRQTARTSGTREKVPSPAPAAGYINEWVVAPAAETMPEGTPARAPSHQEPLVRSPATSPPEKTLSHTTGDQEMTPVPPRSMMIPVRIQPVISPVQGPGPLSIAGGVISPSSGTGSHR